MAKSFEVREDVADKHNAWMQDRIARSVWSKCHSFYRAKSEDGSAGKVHAMFPGSLLHFWWVCRLRWTDYVAVGAEKLERKLWAQKLRNWGGVLLLILVWAATAWWGVDSVMETGRMWVGRARDLASFRSIIPS